MVFFLSLRHNVSPQYAIHTPKQDDRHPHPLLIWSEHEERRSALASGVICGRDAINQIMHVH